MHPERYGSNGKSLRRRNGNVLIFYGGGLCDCATYYITMMAWAMYCSRLFGSVYIGFYSFRCLTQEGLITEWNLNLHEQLKKEHGGYIGTARETDLTNPALREVAIKTCKEYGIEWIILAGGDGSSRQMNEIYEDFEKEGIKFIFSMPMTIDNINGGKSHGILSAVDASIDIIEHTCSTALRTLDGNKYPGIIFTTQGRNRNDILVNILAKIRNKEFLKDAQIIAIPANMWWSEILLRRKLHIESDPCSTKILGKPTVILLSEGADLSAEELVDIAAQEGMKMRSCVIGHYSQINGKTTIIEKSIIEKEVIEAIGIIAEEIEKDKSFTIVYKDDCGATVESPSYFAERNPRFNQKVFLSKEQEKMLSEYIP